MKRFGIDSIQSCITAFSSTLVLFAIAGCFIGSAGVLFVSLMEVNLFTKEEASWPFTIHLVMAAIAGPISTCLNQIISIRSITMIGVLLYSLGTMVCFFSKNLLYITILYGVIAGLGSSLSNILLLASINNIFNKFRATAVGIVACGATVGSIIFPVITQYFINKFGLQGCFLMLGGVSIHAAIGAAGLMQNSVQHIEKTIYPTSPEGKAEIDNNGNQMKSVKDVESRFRGDEKDNGKIKPGNSQDVVKMSTILTSRGFYLSLFNYNMYSIQFFFFIVVIIDYSVKKGVDYNNSVVLLSLFSAGQLFGMVSLGWISDRKCVSRPTYVMSLYFLLCVIFFSLPHIYSYVVLAFGLAISGVVFGSLQTQCLVIFSDYFSKKELLVAVSLTRASLGILTLSRSFLIGLLNDEDGSYDSLFHFMGSLSLVSTIAWIFENVYQRWLSNDNKKPTVRI